MTSPTKFYSLNLMLIIFLMLIVIALAACRGVAADAAAEPANVEAAAPIEEVAENELEKIVDVADAAHNDEADETETTDAETERALKHERVAVLVDLSGSWEIEDYDFVRLRQEGQAVSGSYAYPDDGETIYGYLEGHLSGNTLKAYWWDSHTEGATYDEAEWSGVAQFTLSEDRQVLHGQWRYDDEDEWGGVWEMARLDTGDTEAMEDTPTGSALTPAYCGGLNLTGFEVACPN